MGSNKRHDVPQDSLHGTSPRGSQAVKDRIREKERAKKRARQKKVKNFKMNWLPQKRQLKFLEACGLSHPFSYYMDETEQDKVKIFKRDKKPDKLQKPKARVIGYGGAAGGGKSDALLMACFVGLISNPGANAGFFRRKFTQLEGPGGAIMRSKELFEDFPGASYNGTQRRWTFESLNNAVLEFCHIQNEDDVYSYQSQQFDYVAYDEATQFTRFMYRYMMTRNRATVKGVYPLMMLATNPGNVGHVWFKEEFVDPGPAEEPHEVEVGPGRTEKHMFIPAYLSDNIVLEDRDPEYRKSLENQGDIERERLLKGNWDIHSGQFFHEFDRDIHVIEPFRLNDHWKRFISVDYGLDMAAVYWFALDDMGFYYCYKGFEEPDMILSEVAEKIRAMTSAIERDELAYTVIPPDMFNQRERDTGKSGRQILVESGLSGYGLREADNRRVEGWRIVREYLKPIDDPRYDEEDPPKTARLLFFDGSVSKLIGNLPMLQRSEKDPNDVADEPHELTHGPDALRYFLMSRPPLKSRTEEDRKIMRDKIKRRTSPRSKVTNY